MTVTPCQKCPLRRLKWYRDFTPEELQFIASFKSGELKVRAGGNILSENENSPNLYTVLSGWVLKYKAIEDGRRQVTNYGLPGDLIGLQASVFEAMHHSVEALTDVTLCILPRDKLWTLYEKFAGLAFDMTWLGAREESILGEYLLSVGQRRAWERLAFILQVHTNKALQRLRQTGCFEWAGTSFEMLDEKKLATLASYEPPPDKVRPFL